MKKLVLVLVCLTAILGADPHPDARDYWHEVTPAEWRVMHTIVTTIANTKNPFSLWNKEEFLKHEGVRADVVHPLRFLLTLFTDEELKVATRNIKKHPFGTVWNRFSNGFSESLDRARARDNLSDDVVEHFATTLELDVEKVQAVVAANQWDSLMNMLVSEVPRKGDFRRYDL